ncbi:hypothetical protein L873DRAFT_163308 [Choiromyces venosus 120613-1]|uniref:Uncharacterized protein n=1 Tax=Choiromyces venosus 120613-1 TaxID=1336337 RepID=A0A3N4K4V6_9PEZI|nr:hypothetical protein L873DRAFT_163308 [Choiromyces venosus 120613-1]
MHWTYHHALNNRPPRPRRGQKTLPLQRTNTTQANNTSQGQSPEQERGKGRYYKYEYQFWTKSPEYVKKQLATPEQFYHVNEHNWYGEVDDALWHSRHPEAGQEVITGSRYMPILPEMLSPEALQAAFDKRGKGIREEMLNKGWGPMKVGEVGVWPMKWPLQEKPKDIVKESYSGTDAEFTAVEVNDEKLVKMEKRIIEPPFLLAEMTLL